MIEEFKDNGNDKRIHAEEKRETARRKLEFLTPKANKSRL